MCKQNQITCLSNNNNNFMDKIKLKKEIQRKAFLLGWKVTVFDDKIVIKKNKYQMKSFENNVEFFLKILLNSEDYNTTIQKVV